MSDSEPRDGKAPVTRTDRAHLQKLCRKFRLSLENGAPQAEDFVEGLPPAVRAEAVVEMLAAEFEKARNSGQQIDVESYYRRFPEFRKSVDSAVDLTHTEPVHDRGDETGLDVIQRRDDAHLEEAVPDRIGRYQIQGILGEGGFGRVYRAFDTQLERNVALKVPSRRVLGSRISLKLLLAEARSAAALSHPGLVPVYDVQVEENRPYIVMELIVGGNLSNWYRESRPDRRALIQRILEVTEAVQYAHEQRFVHRDLKPGNILVDAQGRAHVADFGLAVHESGQGRRAGEVSGTPAYMAPEQIRGETHRLDGRSDLWSIGVILYELLVGSRPFRADNHKELYDQITSQDPRPPRQLNASVPSELERICLKCLEKRRTDRYASAADLAEDLRFWLSEDEQRTPVSHGTTEIVASVAFEAPSTVVVPPQVIPKGLRSFDRHDAEFFLQLLPGPRDRYGVPESIRFWRTKIEEREAEQTFSVGLMYGPSGCGKSSLVKAGLLPLLSDDVLALYVEATHDDTETRLANALHKRLPHLPNTGDLVETFATIRGQGIGGGRKLIVVLDQFEQWLHADDGVETGQLLDALRQCDGTNLQCIIMVRDDFWLAVSRFLRELEVRLVDGHNGALVDLFDADHARRVLTSFGRAYRKLPDDDEELSDEQAKFVREAVTGLAVEDKVVCVRLALFAEMMKGRPWNPTSLREVGGTKGVGVTFLEETFSAQTAPPEHRRHQTAARAVLKGLLPEEGSEIKGGMQSYDELLQSCGYQSRRDDFEDLIRILDTELRLITPTDPDGSDDSDSIQSSSRGSAERHRYYQLTHDYLVPSLREWLSRKQQETRRGRAELRLAERAAIWNAKPENRHLPSLLEWNDIRTRTDQESWTDSQRKMMARAARVHGGRALLVATIIVALVLAGLRLNHTTTKRRNQAEAARLVEGLLRAETSQVSGIIHSLDTYEEYSTDELVAAYTEPPPESPNAKLHAAMALLYRDDSVLETLREGLLGVSPAQFPHVRDRMADHKRELIRGYWAIVDDQKNESAGRRFQAACALASFDPDNKAWQDKQLSGFLAQHLVGVTPSAFTPWRDAMRGVKKQLIGPLSEIFRSDATSQSARKYATDTLADYLKDDPVALTSLLLDSDVDSFETLFVVLSNHRQLAIQELNEVLAQELSPDWEDPDLASFHELALDAKLAIDASGGLVADYFAFCQKVSWETFTNISNKMGAAGYRLVRVRPYQADSSNGFVAAIWNRDGGKYTLDTELDSEQLPIAESAANRDGLVPVDLARLPRGESVKPTFTLLWGEPTSAGEQRRMIADLSAADFNSAIESLNEAGYTSQVSIAVWLNDAGERRYGGIWSNRGEASRVKLAYPGFELVDWPQWDVAVAPKPSDAVNTDSYAALWRASTTIESRTVSANSTQQLASEAKRLVEQGYRPVAVTMAIDEGVVRPTFVFHRPIIPDDAKEALAIDQAMAGTALLRFGETEPLSGLFLELPDPRLRSYLLHRLAEYADEAEPILRQLATATDVSYRQSLVLLIGELANRDRMSEKQQRDATREVAILYANDPDAGIHAAAEWTLKKLDAEHEIATVREAYASGEQAGARQWYVTKKANHSMVVLDADQPFLMGSPVTESERFDGAMGRREIRHRRHIGRRFAIAAHEVTVAQFKLFRDHHGFNRSYARQNDAPANLITWYDAAKYCNWLSEQDGIHPDEWCYDTEQSFFEGMVLVPDYLQLTGYRLPTEAEWEYACRAGTTTARFYGETPQLLDQYAWYSGTSGDKWLLRTGSLKPNAWGLFDMLGNAYEWCHNRPLFYETNDEVTRDVELEETLSNGHVRVLRGGSFFNNAHDIRSAKRSSTRPDFQDNGNGFRPVRTMPSP